MKLFHRNNLYVCLSIDGDWACDVFVVDNSYKNLLCHRYYDSTGKIVEVNLTSHKGTMTAYVKSLIAVIADIY